jgi:hypothetical protein
MDEMNDSRILLDVPYFRQTRTATCGPACLMMVMKYWDSSFEFSRRIEFQLWMESFSFFLFGGTFQYGLASAVVKRGFNAEIYQKDHFSAYYPAYPRVAGIIENIVSRKTYAAKIPIHSNQPILEVIQHSLQRKTPPIVFVNLKPILGENVFHWVVVTGMDSSTVYMNDPYVPLDYPQTMKKDFPVTSTVFQQAISTDTGRNLRLPPCVIVVQINQYQPKV